MSQDQPPERRFAVDTMLGKLAKWLRVLGFDAPSISLADRSAIESLLDKGFIPVTRREKFRDIEGIVFIRSDRPFEQLKEVVSLVSLSGKEVRLFSRCTLCNACLVRIPAEAAFGAVPDYVFETASDFRRCPECGRVYWTGSHRRRMIEKLESLTGWGLREGDEGGAK